MRLSLNMLPLLRVGRVTILLPAALMLILSTYFSSTDAQDDLNDAANHAERGDMLAYVSMDSQLILYDPRDRTETILLENVRSFELARDGRIAFTKQDENDVDLYVFDPSTPALNPINVSQNPAANNDPLAWSPDGQYLAFHSSEDGGGQSLYVWDGETAVNIMPQDARAGYDVDWSNDGTLAFTVTHRGANPDETDQEIYMWDGNLIVNVSQNPQGQDGGVSWSNAGQLMFASERNGERGIYVWDGISFKDGLPNSDTFTQLPSELASDGAWWIDDGSITFTLYPAYSPSGKKEIVIWDLASASIIRQIHISSDNAYSRLTADGQMIFSSHLASGVPSVYLDIENTNGNILLSIHTGSYSWSSGGYLAYCGLEDGASRILSIWDGEETWVVAKVSYRPVQWQYGRGTFSCNNG